MSMNEDRFAGTGKNLGVEQGFGRATGDELEGKLKQATGAAQDIYGQAKDAAADAYGKAKEGRWRRSKVGAGTRCAVGRVSAQRH